MKIVGFLILALFMSAAMGGAQQITEPGWYSSLNLVTPLPAGAFGSANAKQNSLLAGQGSSSIAEAVTPEIQALALGLENDPLRIFNYVHDHIRHVLYFGSKKGAQLTLMERSGNDFDQCALLVALLQAAGYTNVGYQFGILKMPYDATDGTHNDLHHWLQLGLVNTNWSNTSAYFAYLLPNRGYPGWFDEGDNNTIAFDRVWVTLTVGTTTYTLDPAFKVSEPVAGINLQSAMGLNTNTLMTAAGGTATADYVQGVSEANVRSALVGMNNNLLAVLQANNPNASVQQILGGWQIVPWTNGLSLANPPFPLDTRGGTYPELTWTSQPTAFMSTLGISFGAINQQWYYPQLQGQRLSLTFSPSGLAQLWLDDTLVAQTNTTGGSVSVTLAAKHPYGQWDTVNNIPIDSGWSDVSVPNTYQSTNSSYAILYCFEPDSKYLKERQDRLAAYLQQGYTNGSRQIVTETLNTMGLNWMIQTKMNDDLLAQQVGILPQFHERLGRMAQERSRGYYVDIYLQFDGSIQNGVVDPSDLTFQSLRHTQYFDVSSYVASSMEHGLIQELQTKGLVAASTVKILELANTNKQSIYLANSANWTAGANVRSHLANYTLANLDSLISQGYSILLPTNGAIPVAGAGSWTGQGYIELQSTSTSRRMGMIIGGGYSGGYVSDPTATVDPIFDDTTYYSLPDTINITPVYTPIVTSADPVNMSDASFRLSTTDLSLGQADPLGITFSRYYSPTRRHYNLSSIGNGWVHSYYFNLQEISDPEASLGTTTPAQASPMLVTTCATLGLYNAQPDPKTWLVTALIAKWGVDQMISNAVSITLGNNTLEFVRQPGGIFTAPASCTYTLTNSGVYKLQERHGRAFNFNSSKQLASITNQSGDLMTLTYTGTNLTQVKDWKNRTLTFSYSGNPARLTQVADSSSRTVKFAYLTNRFDTNLDLVTITDPENKTNTFLYDTNHQIAATYDALGRLVVSNVYDSFGHVVTQYTQGDPNKTWNIFWSDWQTVSQDPAGNKQRYFFDDQSRLIGQQDALANLSQTIYDGQNHVVMTISPLNETNQFLYDANNNMIETIDSLGCSNQLVYDGKNNLIYAIDPRGNINSFGYDPQFRLIGSTNGAGNWITYTYNTDGTTATRVDSGGTCSYGYDANGILSKTSYPGVNTNGFLNDAFGDVLSHTNGRGFVTSFKYNNNRQLTNSITPTNVTTRLTFDAVGNLIKVTDARGFTTTNTWDVLRHLLSTALPATPAGTAVITNAYDNRGWLVKTVDPLGQPLLYTNNAAQRLVSVTDPLYRTVSSSYDADGRKLAVTNGLQQVATNQYDSRGATTLVADPAGRTALYAFDLAGNQVILTNRNGQKWQFQFDAANRLTNTITPLGRFISQVYNNRGLIASTTQPGGQTQMFSYDVLGRLTNRADTVGTTVFKYDADGNPTSIIESTRTNNWTYDAYDRASSYTDANGYQMQYKYDLNGNVTNLVYPGIKNVYYAYDSQNHLTNVLDWANRKTSFTYDLAGRLKTITRPNGTVRTIGYDAAGQTTNITETAAGGTVIAFYTFGWDNAARMQSEYSAPLPHAGTLPTRNMTFDEDNRLTGIDGNPVTMDLNGNMTAGPLTNDTVVTYTYDGRNRLVGAGGVGYNYDPAGNRTAVTNGMAATTYIINPNAKLSQVLMRVQSGVTNYYIYGAGLLYQVTEAASGTNTLTYHFDYRGSTVALTDGTGTNVTDRMEYSTYATLTYRNGTNNTPFLFNGLYGVMTDANGLLYMRARYYNPYLCRFVNPDPSGFSGGLNMYAYADGNPVSYLDPFGLSFWSVTGHFIEGAVIGAGIAIIVVIAAPEIAAGGAIALGWAGVEAATATTVSSAAVTVGLAATATYGTSQVAGDAVGNWQAQNWDAVAFDAGNLTGGLIVGASGGGRSLAQDITGQPSSIPPSWNPFGDLSASVDPNYKGGSLLTWLASAPTPQSGAGVLALTAGIASQPALNNPSTDPAQGNQISSPTYFNSPESNGSSSSTEK